MSNWSLCPEVLCWVAAVISTAFSADGPASCAARWDNLPMCVARCNPAGTTKLAAPGAGSSEGGGRTPEELT